MMEKRAEGTMKFEIDVDLPDEITDATFEESIAKPVRQELVLRLFRERRIAGGRAAHLLGLTRIAFLDLLKEHGIPHTDYTFQDWQEDTETLERVLTEQEPPSDERGRG